MSVLIGRGLPSEVRLYPMLLWTVADLVNRPHRTAQAAQLPLAPLPRRTPDYAFVGLGAVYASSVVCIWNGRQEVPDASSTTVLECKKQCELYSSQDHRLG